MPSLSAHLRNRETHTRLPFHADCPICRDERLLGEVAPHAVVSQRAKATVAAAVIAITSVGPPAAAFATEPVSEWEGATEPTDSGAVDVRSPGDDDDAHVAVFDPGGRAIDVPANAGQDDDDDAAPDDPAHDDPDAAPVIDDDAPDAVDPHDQSAGPPAAQSAPPAQSASPVPPAPPAPPAQPAQPQRPTAPATDPAPPATGSQQPRVPAARGSANRPAPRAPAGRHGRGRARLAQAPRPAPAQPDAAARAATPAPAPRAPTNTSRPTAQANHASHADHADHAGRADQGARTHTVRAGESLWSIASDVLGPAAPPLQIARNVHRLWELNKERIATGDPDLLMIDTRLRLR